MNLLAQAQQNSGVDIGAKLGSPYGQTLGIGSLISIVISGGLVLAGIIVVVFFVFGGLHMIHGAGSGDPKSSAQGKEAITWAVAGFLIVFSTYWILRLLESLFGISFLFAN